MKSMTIGKKRFIGFGSLLVLSLVVGVLLLESMAGLGASLNQVINVNARKRFLAADIKSVRTSLLRSGVLSCAP
jgi:hypothetical protein